MCLCVVVNRWAETKYKKVPKKVIHEQKRPKQSYTRPSPRNKTYITKT